MADEIKIEALSTTLFSQEELPSTPVLSKRQLSHTGLTQTQYPSK